MTHLSSSPAAILLDMDGTLFNTEALYKDLWQSTAQKFGLDLTDDLYQKFIGASYSQCKGFIAALGGENFDLDQFFQTMQTEEETLRSRPIPLKPGARELLVWVKESGIPMGLVTSSGRETVTNNFSYYGGEEQFQVIITSENVSQVKPNPEPYLLACQKLGVNPTDTIAVEDSNPGACSAIAAGCQTVMIPDVLPAEDDVASRVTLLLNSLEQLPALIEPELITQ